MKSGNGKHSLLQSINAAGNQQACSPIRIGIPQTDLPGSLPTSRAGHHHCRTLVQRMLRACGAGRAQGVRKGGPAPEPQRAEPAGEDNDNTPGHGEGQKQYEDFDNYREGYQGSR
jgi:hypothetical protein